MPYPTIHQLEVFVTVARCGSFARAAEELLLSPASVTLQVQHLEKQYGTRLLDRTSRGAILTESGTILLRTAESVFAGLQNAATAIERIQHVDRGRLDIGGTELVGIYQLPRAVAMFRRRFPQVEVNLLAAHSDRIEQALLNRTIEVAIVAGGVKSPKLVVVPCGTLPLVLLAHPDNPISASPVVTRAALTDQTLIVREPGSGTHQAVHEAIARFGLRFRNIVEVEGAECVSQMVAADQGIGFGSAASNETVLQLGQLVALEIEGVTIEVRYDIVFRADRSLSDWAQEFLECCREVLNWPAKSGVASAIPAT